MLFKDNTTTKRLKFTKILRVLHQKGVLKESEIDIKRVISKILLTLIMPRKKQTKKTFGSKVKSTLIKVDKFPDTLQMQFRKGMTSLHSHTGGMLSFVQIVVVAIFSVTTFSMFAGSRKSTTTAAVFDQAFGAEDFFGAEQDLNIAVGIDGADEGAFQRNG